MSLNSYHHAIKAPASGAPLVFAFHGTGGDVLEHGAARFFRGAGEGVYDMADLAQRTVAMAAFVRAQRAAHPGHPVLALAILMGRISSPRSCWKILASSIVRR